MPQEFLEKDRKTLKPPHNVIMENRRSVTITGVLDMDSFDEGTVVLFTEDGELTIRGLGLHINKIDVASGNVTMEGEVDSLTYTGDHPQKGGLISRLFR
jgi:sporulation protein YabP